MDGSMDRWIGQKRLHEVGLGIRSHDGGGVHVHRKHGGDGDGDAMGVGIDRSMQRMDLEQSA